MERRYHCIPSVCLRVRLSVATHRHQSEDRVDDSDSYGGVDRLGHTGASEDIRGVVKDLGGSTSTDFQ